MGKMRKMDFTCRACIAGERWGKETQEWKRKAKEMDREL